MTTSTAPMISLFGLDPGTYQSHPLHAVDRTYQETNCYADLVIEFLHARGDEPLAALGSIVRMDFEGDQWTFFKPPPEDLERLFGIDVHEMQPYRSIPDQLAELIADGRTMTIELDAWHLPDTMASSYHTEHVKTSVAAEGIDIAGRRFRYFHNTALHELGGDDYVGAFRLDEPAGHTLPPYTELVRLDAGPRLHGDDLRAESRAILREHLDRIPMSDPFERFGDRLGRDLGRLLEGDQATYHAYAFATVRMVGAGFELCASHVEWLLGEAGDRAVRSMHDIVEGSKLLGFKLARRRPFDTEAAMRALSEARREALEALDDVVR